MEQFKQALQTLMPSIMAIWAMLLCYMVAELNSRGNCSQFNVPCVWCDTKTPWKWLLIITGCGMFYVLRTFSFDAIIVLFQSVWGFVGRAGIYIWGRVGNQGRGPRA